MGGICAVMGPHAEQFIKKICGSLQHRGPDDEGFFISKNLALGHRALRTNRTPVHHQPLTNEDRTIWITFDGEIYNKRELIEQLEKTHTFDTDSSAEVAIHSYEEYGPLCVNQFNGRFSFCLWDSMEEQLFCARDRVGIKPLYYCILPSIFLLASEIKALLTVPSVPRKPNEQIIYEYLLTGHQHCTEDTFFIGIKRLLPAHCMFIKRDSIKVRGYWNPVKTSKTDRSKYEDQYYASELRRLLRDSIKLRVPLSRSVGTFLSGGLDSTAIACMMNDILTSNHQATTLSSQKLFSAIYRESIKQGDERPYIAEVARALSTKIDYVYPSAEVGWDDIKHFIYQVDEPVSVFNYYVFWCLSRKAREKVRITFYAMGGGQFGQFSYFRPYRRYLKELWKRKKIVRLLIELVGALPQIRMSTIGNMLNRSKESIIKGLISPKFETHLHPGSLIEDTSFNTEYLQFLHSLSVLDHLRVCDRVSSAFSIEPRYPLLDHRILEFAFSLPINQKIRNGWNKYALRNALKGLIPEAIRKSRKKFGAPIPIELWMRQLRRNIRELFESDKFRKRGYFNQPAILDTYDRFCEGKLNRFSSGRYASLFWRIINLELWMRAFFDTE